MSRENYGENMSITGGKIMIIGDLHFSDVFTGKHKNYLKNCCRVLRDITERVEANKPSCLILLGDIIGWNETNIKSRSVFAFFCRIIKQWNAVCPVVVVQGNHDTKGYPDFLFLEEFGLFRNPKQLDYYNDDGNLEVRFHIVNYGDEDRELELAENGASNVVLGHQNYTINGVTTWYASADGVELGRLTNFNGVDYVISGHIHNPSPDIYHTQMDDGSSCFLLYPGCPTRPIKEKQMYESCWIVWLEYKGSETDLRTETWELQPSSELFDDNIIEERSQEDVEELMRKEALHGVLEDLLKFRMTGGDPFAQVDTIPNASPEAKKIAKDYLQLAMQK